MRASRTKTTEPDVEEFAHGGSPRENQEQDIPEVSSPEAQQMAVRDTIVPGLYDKEYYTDEQLRDATSFEDFVNLAKEQYDSVDVASDVLGDGFALLKEEGKQRLVGLPLLLMSWSFYKGDFGSNFVAVRVVARNPDGSASKYIINDGSTGICDTLAAYTKNTGKTGALFARNGLRASGYTYCSECGQVVDPTVDTGHQKDHKKAVTYYIDTSV